MAKKVEVLLTDDLDGSEAAGTVHFGLGGAEYEIDLSKANEKKLRSALEPFIGASRKVPTAARTRTPRSRSTKLKAKSGEGPTSQEVRAWAQEHGIEVSNRGRIPSDVYVQFQDAQG